MSRRKVRILEKQIDFGEYKLVVILYNKDSEAKEVLEDQYDVDFQDGELDNQEEKTNVGFVKMDGDIVALCLHHSFTICDLVHELVHLTWAMLSRNDILLSDETEEVYARHTDAMYRVIIEMLKKDKVKLPNV